MNARRPATLAALLLCFGLSVACNGKQKSIDACFDTASAGTQGQLDDCATACTKYKEYRACARVASEGRRSCVGNTAHCKLLCEKTQSFNVFMNTNDRLAMCGTF